MSLKCFLCLLQQLCAIPEIANSEEMQEFLALNTDARIAFVKKPFMVSRIDKVPAGPLCPALVSHQSGGSALKIRGGGWREAAQRSQ